MALKFVWVFYSVGPNYHGKVKMVCYYGFSNTILDTLDSLTSVTQNYKLKMKQHNAKF